jgi:DMSO reductase family type II enzyme heme b subunit
VLRDGALPGTPDDEAWSDIPAAYIPLVGQIIEPPRWFVPTVRTMWVQAIHNGEELALRLVWNDPSRSPDPAWDEWRQLVADVMQPKEAPLAEGSLPDAAAVQFPADAVTGRDLPYFLMGDERTPVHLWRWSSEGAVTEVTARGLDTLEPVPATPGAVVGAATYADGQWQLVLRRTLTSAEGAARPAFRAGEPIPFALYAWDGSNGESGKRGAIGSWYFLYLEQPVTTAVYVVPIITILITALLGFAAVRYAQSAHRQGERAPKVGVALAEP